MRSKTEPSTGRNEPPEGYSYNYETRSLDGSDVELHGALSSEINQKDNSRVQTIAVYTDVNDVIDRISEEERRKHATEGSALKENEDWEQQQLQLEQYQIQQHQLQQHEQQPQQQQQQEYQQQLPPKQ
jgi:ribonuclease HI